MKKHILSLVLCATSAACVNVHPQNARVMPTQQQAAKRTLNVDAIATQAVTPEFAKLNIQFSIQKESEADARKALHQAIRTLSETLTKLGIKKEDIQFQGASVAQAYKSDPNTGRNLPNGFEARKKTSVTIRNLEKLSDSLRKIIDTSAQVGSVSDVTLGTSKMQHFEG